jgi:hypothetical protein
MPRTSRGWCLSTSLWNCHKIFVSLNERLSYQQRFESSTFYSARHAPGKGAYAPTFQRLIAKICRESCQKALNRYRLSIRHGPYPCEVSFEIRVSAPIFMRIRLIPDRGAVAITGSGLYKAGRLGKLMMDNGALLRSLMTGFSRSPTQVQHVNTLFSNITYRPLCLLAKLGSGD